MLVPNAQVKLAFIVKSTPWRLALCCSRFTPGEGTIDFSWMGGYVGSRAGLFAVTKEEFPPLAITEFHLSITYPVAVLAES